ncbi:MAG: hemerythrin domain-containing protein [Ignavibacteriaceae bacterium]|nr:hemerythrin domain-containing protein [Ignavibacteriaceae bacterium]
MKRDPAIAPLSREHHTSLILAQILKKNAPEYKDLPVTTEGKLKYLFELMETHLGPHFRAEERIMEYLDDRTDLFKPMNDRIYHEHKLIREAVLSLQKGSATIIDDMDDFAQLLEGHIRFEEREYFQYLQDHLSEEELQMVAKLESQRG